MDKAKKVYLQREWQSFLRRYTSALLAIAVGSLIAGGIAFIYIMWIM